MADRVVATREESKSSPDAPKRTLGFAAGAMLVAGAVVASAFGFNNGSSPVPSAAAGEPVGALPSKGAPAPQAAAPAAVPDAEQVTNPAAAEGEPRASSSPEGEIGRAASIKPPVQAKAPAAPAPAPNKPAAPAPQAPAPGPVQSLAEPVTNTVGGSTLTGVVAPVTQTVDDTLTPALSLIGGLLGR